MQLICLYSILPLLFVLFFINIKLGLAVELMPIFVKFDEETTLNVIAQVWEYDSGSHHGVKINSTELGDLSRARGLNPGWVHRRLARGLSSGEITRERYSEDGANVVIGPPSERDNAIPIRGYLRINGNETEFESPTTTALSDTTQYTSTAALNDRDMRTPAFRDEVIDFTAFGCARCNCEIWDAVRLGAGVCASNSAKSFKSFSVVTEDVEAGVFEFEDESCRTLAYYVDVNAASSSPCYDTYADCHSAMWE